MPLLLVSLDFMLGWQSFKFDRDEEWANQGSPPGFDIVKIS
jgi:hypothetical protein